MPIIIAVAHVCSPAGQALQFLNYNAVVTKLISGCQSVVPGNFKFIKIPYSQMIKVSVGLHAYMATNSLRCVSKRQKTHGNVLQNRKKRRGYPEHEDQLW
jgi:hypothetical protein